MISCKEYGKALYMLADEENIVDTVFDQVNLIKSILKENPEYIKLLDTPAVPNDEKIGLIDSAFGGADEIVLNFIKILCLKKSVYQFEKCASEYMKLYDVSKGIVRAVALTAVPMTEEQVLLLKTKLDQITGKTVILENRVDSSIIGGVSVRMPDVQLDGSIKNKLKNFRESLGSVIV